MPPWIMNPWLSRECGSLSVLALFLRFKIVVFPAASCNSGGAREMVRGTLGNGGIVVGSGMSEVITCDFLRIVIVCIKGPSAFPTLDGLHRVKAGETA